MNKPLLLAVSGGPDSMALLAMAVYLKLNIVAVHVNYQKRMTAWRDEMIVRNYCLNNNVPLYVSYPKIADGNFQKLAREQRYAFFKKIGAIYGTDIVLLAHQMDDYLETAIMQIQRGSTPFCFGIADWSCHSGLKVFHPFLGLTKKQLIKYCHDHNIPYGIDESNLQNIYRRNQIRHTCLDFMSYSKKLDLYYLIESVNANRQKKIEDYTVRYRNNSYSLAQYAMIADKDLFLRLKLYCDLSGNQLTEIRKQISAAKAFEMQIRDKYVIKEYEMIYFTETDDDYAYSVLPGEKIKGEYFAITDTASSLDSCTVTADDYPLVIRNYRPGDKIKMRFGHKRLSRFFIDRKIPAVYRKRWPVVLNKEQEIILVPGLGCNVEHYTTKPNFFMVELLNTRESKL